MDVEEEENIINAVEENRNLTATEIARNE